MSVTSEEGAQDDGVEEVMGENAPPPPASPSGHP